MKPPDLPVPEEVLAEDLNPEYEREWVRVALARAIAVKVLTYRLEHGLSQAALAERLKMTQPAVAQLESAEHNFARARLLRISQALEGGAQERSESAFRRVWQAAAMSSRSS